jgi:hypothetical protein
MDNNSSVNNIDKPKPKEKKKGTLVSAYIEQTAFEALKRHCQVTGQSKTKAIERAILKYCTEK